MVIFKKVLLLLMVVIMFACFIAGVYLQYKFIYTLPETPQSSIGRIYQLNVHGSIVYLTRGEHLLLEWLFWTGGAATAAIIIISAIWEPFSKK